MTRKITPVEGSLGELLNKNFVNQFFTGFIRVDGVVLIEAHKQSADAIEDFEVRDDDVWVCSFPKSGTTWTQEMVWCIAHDPDLERSKVHLAERFPFLEQKHYDVIQHDYRNVIDDLPSPRFIKSHLPFHLLPRQLRTGVKKAKIVYVARDPKDTCISYFHYLKLAFNLKGNFDEFCDLFIANTVPYAPYWDHVSSYWTKKYNENILLLKYEDMKKDLTDVMKRTALFFGKKLTSDQLSSLSGHLSFDSMKVNPTVNNQRHVTELQRITGSRRKGEFMRSGNVDQWKTVMSPEIVKRFNDWTGQSSKSGDFQF